MGLVDVQNRPDPGMVKTAASALKAPKRRIEDLTPSEPDIPYLDAWNARNLEKWPHLQSVRKQTDGAPRGDLFALWNESGLYIAAYWFEDRFFENFYKDGVIPEDDRAAFTLSLGKGVKIIAKMDGLSGVNLEGANLIEYKGGTKNQLLIRIPANRLRHVTLTPSDKIEFDAELTTRARGYRMTWSGVMIPSK
jgi:hypothetical protein